MNTSEKLKLAAMVGLQLPHYTNTNNPMDFPLKNNIMHERIKELAEQAGSTHKQNLGVYQFYVHELQKFAELIIQDCEKLNRSQSYELSGVIDDIEGGTEFDSICLNTVKRVQQYLAENTLTKHFGVK